MRFPKQLSSVLSSWIFHGDFQGSAKHRNTDVLILTSRCKLINRSMSIGISTAKAEQEISCKDNLKKRKAK